MAKQPVKNYTVSNTFKFEVKHNKPKQETKRK